MNLARSDLADLNLFMAILARRSFRGAADEIGISTSAASHAMKGLEARLGIRLLNRTSRSVTATAAGAALAERLEVGFAEIGAGLAALDDLRGTPKGRLRINALRDAAHLLLASGLPVFTKRYPGVEVEIAVDDRFIDITANGFDAGIRYEGTIPEDMIATRVSPTLRWVVIASPDYIARYGCPTDPSDLRAHSCIRIRTGDGKLYKWEFGEAANAIAIDVPGSITLGDSNLSIAAAVAGLGLFYCLEARVRDELADGRLQVAMPSWISVGPPFCVYHTSRKHVPTALRALVAVLREQVTQ